MRLFTSPDGPDRRLKTNRRSLVYFPLQKCLGFQATIYQKQTLTRQTEICNEKKAMKLSRKFQF